MKYLLLIPLLFLFKNEKNDLLPGNYKSTEDSYCNPQMIIYIKNDTKTSNFSFDIYRSNKKIITGKLGIRTDDNQKILMMKNTVGIYRNDSIIIQNSGNEMNQYHNFKNCKAKYLIFLKERK